MITQNFPPEAVGGAGRINDLAKGLGRHCSVTVLCPPPTFPYGLFAKGERPSRIELTQNVSVFRLWTFQPRKTNPTVLERIAYYLAFPVVACGWLLLNFRRYDVVITTTPPLFTALPGVLAHTLRRKWIVDVRDLWLGAAARLGFVREGGLLVRLARLLERLSYEKSDCVSVLTNSIGRHIRVLAPSVESSRIVLIPHGISLTHFMPSPLRREFQIIYSGSLGRAQALNEVIAAWKDILRLHAVKLIILGKGETEEDLKILSKQLGVGEFVQFIGAVPRSRVPQYVSRSLIGLVPLRAGLGLDYAAPTKVFEYMACGVPFVASCGGELEEIAKSSGAGIVVRDKAPDISRAIIFLLGHPQILKSMADNGRKYVQTNYANEVVYDRLFNEIKGICQPLNQN